LVGALFDREAIQRHVFVLQQALDLLAQLIFEEPSQKRQRIWSFMVGDALCGPV
jgi:hypothetical protein